MFRPNWPSSGVQVVVIKVSTAHCNAVLLSLYNCLGLILGYVRRYARVCLICNTWWVILEFYFKVYMHIQFLYICCYLRFCWFIFGSVCGCPECFCWHGNYFYGGQPSRPSLSVTVGVSVTVVWLPWVQVMLCATIWCSFPVLLWILGYVCLC
jgi:hypothetical protein